MKAVVITEAGEAEILEKERPICGADEVLVRVGAVGLCQRDVELYQGTRSADFFRYPVTPGHEWSGEIVEVGAQVRHLQVGRKVVAESIRSCGICRNCRQGLTNLCEAGYDETGFTSAGSCAEYIVVPARMIHVLPDNASLEEAALLEPAAIVMQAFLRAQPLPGSVIVVLGTDTVSLLAVQIAQLYSPAALIVLGFGEERLKLAQQFGATHTANMSRVEPLNLIREASSGQGADLVFEGADHTQGVAEALRLARRGGSVLLTGIASSTVPLSVESDIFAMNALSVYGIFGASTAAWSQIVQLFRNGQLQLAPLISHRFPLEEYEDALYMLSSRQKNVLKIILRPA